MENVKHCQRCILPETFPNIKFNDEGICHLCLNYQNYEVTEEGKIKYRNKFIALLEKRQGRHSYDCLMAYSGGKDSSYTLYLMVNQFKMSVLALTFDNGFIPDQTKRNIKSVVNFLKIDHIFICPDFNHLKSIFRTASEKVIFPRPTLRLASSVCTACMGIVKLAALKHAVEKNIPFIIYGWSPGQAPLKSSVFKNNLSMLEEMQDVIYRAISSIVGHNLDDYFLNVQQMENSDQLPYNISPLAFLEYNEAIIFKTIQQMGWQNPTGVDSNSTNCLLNSYANMVHKQQFGYHPYVFELAKLVREGYLDRTEALNRINTPEDMNTIALVKRKLELP